MKNFMKVLVVVLCLIIPVVAIAAGLSPHSESVIVEAKKHSDNEEIYKLIIPIVNDEEFVIGYEFDLTIDLPYDEYEFDLINDKHEVVGMLNYSYDEESKMWHFKVEELNSGDPVLYIGIR